MLRDGCVPVGHAGERDEFEKGQKKTKDKQTVKINGALTECETKGL